LVGAVAAGGWPPPHLEGIWSNRGSCGLVEWAVVGYWATNGPKSCPPHTTYPSYCWAVPRTGKILVG